MEDVNQVKSNLKTLNTYLESRDVSPVRAQLRTPWENASGRTKRYYARKAGQAVASVVRDISPNEAGTLFREVTSSQILQRQLSSSDEDFENENVDETLMASLSECYRAAPSWSTRRQILSIMADKLRFKRLQQYIPDITKFKYTEAKRHCLLYGRGVPVPQAKVIRQDFSIPQIEHFITFITSPHVVQDLPFGEQTIYLSNNDAIKIPNVIRTLIPERIVRQYLAFCEESRRKPLSRTTLLRILKVCTASTRKSLQGLDYVSSMGAEGFDDLLGVVEQLTDGGHEDMDWGKNTQERLRTSKRYLKSDYKVRYFGVSNVNQIVIKRLYKYIIFSRRLFALLPFLYSYFRIGCRRESEGNSDPTAYL
jgi:hypothetical protein